MYFNSTLPVLVLILLLYFFAYKLTVWKIEHYSAKQKLTYQAKYHGYLVIMLAFWGALLLELTFSHFYDSLISGFLISSLPLLTLALIVIQPSIRANLYVERINAFFFNFISKLTLAVAVIIVLVILFNAWPFFQEVPLHKFLFGTYWNPQTAELVGHKESSFGLLPLLLGTILIALIATLVALPIGLASSIYLAEFAGKKTKAIAKSVIELLAGVPTVVYGYFAAIIVGPKIKALGQLLGLEMTSESALAAGLVMGVMIMPYITSLTEDVISAIPKAAKDGGLALGLTRSEAMINIVLPVAAPGIIASLLLALSRAIGETMIVAMAAGLSAKMTLNPLQSVTTITVQIVRLLSGDQEYGSITTSSAFALALTLFTITLLLNSFATGIISKYRKKYE